MSYLKMLGITSVAAAALMLFASSASATILTSPISTTYTGSLKLESEGFIEIHGPWLTFKCKSTMEAKVETHGAGVTAKGALSGLTFTDCNFPVTVIKRGSLEIHGISGGNGTVTWSGGELTVHTSLGDCLIVPSNSDIGTLTGSNVTGGNATLDVNSAGVPVKNHIFKFCGTSSTWTGSYSITTPSTLYVDP